MVNDNNMNETKVEKKNEYAVYAFRDLTANKTWKNIRSVTVFAVSVEDAREQASAIYPNADKYNVCLVKYIIGDWSH